MLSLAEPEQPRRKAANGVEEIPLEEHAGRTIQLGWEIEASTLHSLVQLLQEYQDVFTFGPEVMPSMDLAIMEHKLNVDPIHEPVIQNKLYMGPDRAATTTAEV